MNAAEANAVITPLFSKGAESFRVVDTKTHASPEIFVLNSDPLELSFAALAGKALQFPADDHGLHMKLEQLTFSPQKDSKLLALSVKVSGRNFALAPTVNRSELESGRLINIKFPKETNETSVATLVSSGSLQLRYVSSTATLEIPLGIGDVSYESKLGASGQRHLTFVGKGIRLTPNGG